MSKQTVNFYNKFSIYYPIVDIFLKPQKKELFQQINQLPRGKLLEVGVGNGTHLSLYKTHQITGIDTSVKMLEIARKQKISNIKLIQMSGDYLLFEDESFDYAVLPDIQSDILRTWYGLIINLMSRKPDDESRKAFMIGLWMPIGYIEKINWIVADLKKEPTSYTLIEELYSSFPMLIKIK